MSKDVFDVIGIFKMYRDILWLKRRVLYYVSIPIDIKDMFSKEKCDVVGLKYIFQDFLQCVCVFAFM